MKRRLPERNDVTDPRHGARSALIVLFAINLLNFFDRNMFGAVVEPIRKEWALNDSQIGWLATAFIFLYAFVGVPFGRLSDRWKRPRILGIGVAVWSLLTAASGMAWSYSTLLAARVGVGIGEASCAPASSSLIGDLYPAEHRARALSLFMLGLPLGTFFGNLVSGRLAAAYGWRVPFYVACMPGLVLALLALQIPEPLRGAAETAPLAGRPDEGSPYWCVLRIPTIRWLIISGALFNFNMYTISTFLPALLSRYHGLNLKQANAAAAIVLGAVGIPGLLLGGWAADHVFRNRSNGRLLPASGSLLLAAVCICLALTRPAGSPLSFSLLMGTGCLFCYVYYSGVYAAIQDVVQPSLRATAMAIYFCAMYLLGGSVGPVLTGKLSDHFARLSMITAGESSISDAFRAVGLHDAMYVIPLCSFILSMVLFAATRTVSRDMNELQVWMTQPKGKAPSAAKTVG
jgi:MFS family permease